MLALLIYLLWNAQLQSYLNLITLFLVFFNGGLAVVNLIPVFPLDGGRLLRAIMWGVLGRPALSSRQGQRLGFLLGLVLAGWGIVLIAQQARFSWQTGAGTLIFAGLLLLPLLVQPVWPWDRPDPARPGRWSTILVRGPLAGLLIFCLLSVTLALAPMNNGLEAPGIAPPVEPMVEVPASYRHPSAGRFLLTTVFSQTPITVGQWIFGQLNPVIRLVPPERIVPADTTVQEVARRNYRMLDESQTAAIVVGLRLAGYEAVLEGLGARVLAVLPDSPANHLLQPDDVITGLNDDPVGTVLELTDLLKTQDPASNVRLQVEREGRTEAVSTSLMPPAEPDQPPRIGITVEDAGFDVQLPFPVRIVPQKIVGGPSAGLMFTLTVYNLLTPEDLTGGRIIAGTGTIDLDGVVGPIGGVQQKVAGAELAGAEYFLSPPENFDDAVAVARRAEVVKVATAAEAIQFLRSLPPREK
jgi:PDZ domain-containing protein